MEQVAGFWKVLFKKMTDSSLYLSVLKKGLDGEFGVEEKTRKKEVDRKE